MPRWALSGRRGSQEATIWAFSGVLKFTSEIKMTNSTVNRVTTDLRWIFRHLIAIQKIAGWEKLKTLVLDSVSSPITNRVYNMALDEFLNW